MVAIPRTVEERLARMTPHGELMLSAYTESPELGQLAVSYVLKHYGEPKDRLRLAEQPPTPLQERILGYMSQGMSAMEEVERRGIGFDSVRLGRARIAMRLGVRGSLASVRSVIENYENVIAWRRPEEPYTPGTIDPFNHLIFDCMSRGVEKRRIRRLLGAGSVHSVVGPVADALGIDRKRGMLAVVRMYEIGAFTRGLVHGLDHEDYAGARKRFDHQLGPNSPLPRQ
ncbi:MAG TPA: hypothetical protein VLE73_06145 [Candidatus Saccharimonadales bacterium]|nr:hypothetical protein [Candidatus Saccharimonadales bacterium]